MTRTSGPQWERLGTLLRERRIRGLGAHVRTRFAAASPKLSYRVITDLENGVRHNYDDETLAIAEAKYRVVPGSIALVLAGAALQPLDRPEPAKAAAPADEPAAGAADAPERLYPGDPAAQQLLKQGRLDDLADWLEWRREHEAAARERRQGTPAPRQNGTQG